ncbi:MAG: nucleotidyltransferase family protein [Candidatus Gastranaerophilales bacterium]|jgi:predicted nucleotidyltransferase|nr:nucleotidyltransferase family protein [Candidatus Gastranaerophilales bacterium]
MKDYEKILEKLKELKPYLEKEYSVEEIGVFGSYVRDEQTENSDIDILVGLKQGHCVGVIKFCGLQIFLSGIFNKKIDLVSKRGIHPALKKYILSEVKYA